MTSSLNVTPRNSTGEPEDTIKLSLAAFRNILTRTMEQFCQNRVMTLFTPDSKRVLKLAAKTKPPYMTIGVSSVAFIKDRINVTAMARSGLTVPKIMKLEDWQNATGSNGSPDTFVLNEYKAFPVVLDLLITYVDTDAQRILDAGMKLLLHGMVRGFSFEAEYAGLKMEVQVRPDDPPTLQAASSDQWIDFESDDQPGFQGVTYPLKMTTNLIVLGTVPAVRKVVVRYSDFNGNQLEEEVVRDATS